jgi:hypothetical protein
MPKGPQGQQRTGDKDLPLDDVADEADSFQVFTEWTTAADDTAYRDL